MSTVRTQRSVLPGFGLSLGFTLLYLSLIELLPLSATFLKTAGLTWEQFVEAVASPRVLAAYRLSFGASAAAALINALGGVVLAWVRVRYPFPGRRVTLPVGPRGRRRRAPARASQAHVCRRLRDLRFAQPSYQRYPY